MTGNQMLGFGMMRMPVADKKDPSTIDAEAVKRTVRSIWRYGNT